MSRLTYDQAYDAVDYPAFQQVSDDIFQERVRQLEKHGDSRTDGSWLEQKERDEFKCLGILVEELGEVARCIIDGQASFVLEEELIQVAAVASAWVENIRRNGA